MRGPRLTKAAESPTDAAERSEEKERLQGILDEMQELLTEMCNYTAQEVKEDPDVKLIEEAKQRIRAESLPSYKAWAKENNILMPKTRKELYHVQTEEDCTATWSDAEGTLFQHQPWQGPEIALR